MTTVSTAQRVPSKSRLVASLLVVGCVFLALGGCTKGRTTEATSTPTAPTATGTPTYRVSVEKFTFQGMPDTVPANTPFSIVFANKEAFEITHELIVMAIPAGKTVDDVIADGKAKGPDGEGDWLSFGEVADVNTGATGVGFFDLPPGSYAILCWADGKAGGGTGPAHLTIGMAKAFTAA